MYNFNQYLESGEQILYQGKPVPGKGGKSIGGLVFVILFALFMQFLLIWSVVTETGDGDFILLFLVATLFLGLGVYGLIYNLVLKKKQVADDFYCLTNKRAFKYESKKDKLVYGYLTKYEQIECQNVKDNFGDLYMGIILEETSDTAKELTDIKNTLFNPNPEDMPVIVFESIESPRQVCSIAKNARKELLKNSMEGYYENRKMEV